MQTLCELTDAIAAAVHRDTEFATFETAVDNVRSRMFPPDDKIRVIIDTPPAGASVLGVINALLEFAASVASENIRQDSTPESALKSLQEALAFHFNKVRKEGRAQ